MLIDLSRRRELHSLQDYGLRRSVSGGCFYEGENMLVIHPDECIDCGVCVPECPVDAIKPDTEPGLEKWLRLNAEFAKVWPNITMKKPPPPDSKDWEGKPDKFQFFSPNPGAGD
jgi:ferredoxin